MQPLIYCSLKEESVIRYGSQFYLVIEIWKGGGRGRQFVRADFYFHLDLWYCRLGHFGVYCVCT